ncbi:MAG: ATP-binding protein, partial [Pedobacter sp.]
IAFDHEGSPMANGYPNEYAQVLLNILMNARDALVEQNVDCARISIHAFEDAGASVVIISDNADGIAEEIIDKLFDPYFTTKGPEKGTGIGLFMSKTIIEKNMGGKLTVRNTSSGAEFRIEV